MTPGASWRIVVGVLAARVLLVAEDPLVRLAVDRQLDVLGWDALVVNNGDEAIRILQMGVDLAAILLDIRLPDIDGRVVAEVASELAPGARIVFMCERDEQPRDGRWLLVKPFSTAELANVLPAPGAQPR